MTTAPLSAPRVSVGEAVRFGWGVAKRNLLFFIVMFIVTTVVDGIPGKIQLATKDTAPLISSLAGLLGVVIGLVTSVGWTKILLRFADGETPTHADLYAHHPLFFKYFLVSLLTVLAIAAGFILFVIPGFLAAVRYSMSAFLVVDRGLGPIEAMRKSAEITKGNRWALFVAGLALIGVIILGVLALVIGVLWALPTVMVAGAFIYRRLSPREPDAGAGVPVPALPRAPKEWWAAAR